MTHTEIALKLFVEFCPGMVKSAVKITEEIIAEQDAGK